MTEHYPETPYWRSAKIVFVLPLAVAGFILLMYSPLLYVKVVLHLITVPAVCYPLVYRNSPWRSGPTGKALMNMARAIAGLMLVRVVSQWLVFPGYIQVYALALTYLGCSITYQFYVMFRLKYEARAQVWASRNRRQHNEGATP